MTRLRSLEFFIEAGAVLFSLSYTFLYLRGVIPLCYLGAFFGSALFGWLCIRRKIYAEALLQVFYVGMAVYGALSTGDDFSMQHGTLAYHLPWLGLGLVGSILTARWLKVKTDAKRPYLDAFTTVFSLIATWHMVNYLHENWLYWIVIDAAGIVLYASRKLYLGAGLFFLYLLMAIDGFFEQIQWF